MKQKPKLDDACSITTGKLDSNHFVVGGQYPFFTCAPEPLTIDSYAFDDSVILIAGNNASGNFHINRYEGKFNAYQRTYVLTAKPGYDLDYIFYSLKIELKRLKEKSQGSQTKFLTLPILKDIDVIRRELPLQQKIAAVLSALDSKIEINNRINAELEAMAKSLYDYWLVQFDFPDQHGKPYKSNGGKMQWSDELKREIPDGWELENLYVAMDVQYGFPFDTTKFTDDKTQKPVVRIRDILENTVSTFSVETVHDKHKLNKNDLLIGMDGNFHLNFWDKEGAYLNQRCMRIRSRTTSEVSTFQAYFELSPHIRAREKNISRTTVGHLSDKDLKRLFLLRPIKTSQFKPKETFDSLLSKIISNRLENQRLSDLRDWLLPMLMNGQVTVNERAHEMA